MNILFKTLRDMHGMRTHLDLQGSVREIIAGKLDCWITTGAQIAKDVLSKALRDMHGKCTHLDLQGSGQKVAKSRK